MAYPYEYVFTAVLGANDIGRFKIQMLKCLKLAIALSCASLFKTSVAQHISAHLA
jgi:hypothetical protein